MSGIFENINLIADSITSLIIQVLSYDTDEEATPSPLSCTLLPTFVPFPNLTDIVVMHVGYIPLLKLLPSAFIPMFRNLRIHCWWTRSTYHISPIKILIELLIYEPFYCKHQVIIFGALLPEDTLYIPMLRTICDNVVDIRSTEH